MTGTESAVACLWQDLQLPLLRYLRAFDRAAAEDLASDVWVEVARLTGRSPGAVRVLQHRALRSLARRVTQTPVRVTPAPAEALFRTP